MGTSLCVLIGLGLLGLFALAAIVIGILATGSRSRRSEDSSGAAEPVWMAGAAMAGAGDDAQRHPHDAGHDHGSHGSDPEPAGDASGDSGGFDAGSDGGGTDGGGGSDGGGGGGGGD